MKGCFEDTGLLREGVDRFWGHDRGRGHLPVPCPGRAKGAVFGLSLETMKLAKGKGKRPGAEKGRRKGKGKNP